MKKKIITIIGARPQFVKAAAVSRQFRQHPDIEEVIVHTGQHYDDNMSAIFFDELEMTPPTHNLAIGSGSHGAQTGQMLSTIEAVLREEQPSAVLIYGDTNSTLAGALAASKLHIPVLHVEAGLRSFNRKMPEEINRIVADSLSAHLFAPTAEAVKHLQNEGVAADKIHHVGDVMYDVALYYGDKAQKQSQAVANLSLTPKGYILSTIHRAENTDVPERLKAIFDGLMQLATEMPVVLPLHPRTRGVLDKLGMLESVQNSLTLIEPLGFLDMLQLEKNAALIVTDSGGVQKEAFFQQVPCVTLRDETEWVELVELGWNRLAPPQSAEQIVADCKAQLAAGAGQPGSPYGQGDAAQKIVDFVAR
jgi:UDP-GlcNAc3NAcA epimerase